MANNICVVELREDGSAELNSRARIGMAPILELEIQIGLDVGGKLLIENARQHRTHTNRLDCTAIF